MSEAEWVDNWVAALDTAGYRVRTEVPVLGAVCDVVFECNGDLHAVEVKLRNWQRAVSQARDYRLVTNYAYVAMPVRQLLRSVMRGLGSSAREEGIGLIALLREGHDWRIIRQPGSTERTSVWEPAVPRFRHYFEAGLRGWTPQAALRGGAE